MNGLSCDLPNGRGVEYFLGPQFLTYDINVIMTLLLHENSGAISLPVLNFRKTVDHTAMLMNATMGVSYFYF